MIDEETYLLGFSEDMRVAVVSLLIDLLAELPAERLSEMLSASQAAAGGEGEGDSNHVPAWQHRATLLSRAQLLREAG